MSFSNKSRTPIDSFKDDLWSDHGHDHDHDRDHDYGMEGQLS